MNSPHILLASSNPNKLIANVSHIISRRAANKLKKEMELESIKLFRFGEDHFEFAKSLQPTQWRQIISRSYYGAYNIVRAVKLFEDGHYSTDSSDHKTIANLPSAFPNKAKYNTELPNLRTDRNTADYDHTADPSDLLKSVSITISLVEDLIGDAKVYLTSKGMRGI